MSRRDRLLVLAVFLAALAIQLPIYDRWLALLDEGYILALADDINRGKVLYRDVYVDAPFPGAFYLVAAWFRLTGPSVYASRILIVVAFAAFAALLVRIGREVLPRAWAIGLGVAVLCYRIWAFPHWHIVNYSTFAATLLTAAVAVVFASLRRGRPGLLPLAGGLAGAGLLCKQDYGLGVLGMVGLFLLVRPFLADARQPASGAHLLALPLRFTLGAALVVVPSLAWLAAEGALGGLVHEALLRPLSGALHFSYLRLPSLWPLFHQDPLLRAESGSYFPSILVTLRWAEIVAGPLFRETAVWDVGLKLVYYAPFLLWLVAALAWLRAADERRLLLLAYAAAFLVAFNRPHDWVHLMMVYPPALVLATALGEQALRALPRPLGRAAAGALVLALAGLGLASAGLARDLRRQVAWPLRTARGGVFADPHNGPIIEDVLAYIDRHAPPGAPVPVYPIQPMLGFLAAREGAAGFHVIWPVQEPDRDAKIIADLEARRVGTIIYSLSQWEHLGAFRTIAPRLYAYLVERYEMAAVFSRELWGPIVCALARRPDEAPPGRPLLDLVPDPPAAAAAGRRALWPFAQVLAARVGQPGRAAPVRIPVSLPAPGARLVFRYAVNPEHWLDRPQPSGPFAFAIDIEDGTATPVPVFRAALDPTRRLEDRRWTEGAVDLGAWAGRRMTLAFSVTAPVEPAEPDDVAGWAEPRIVGD